MRECVREQRELLRNRQAMQAAVDRLQAEAKAMLLDVDIIDMVLAKDDVAAMQIVIQRLGVEPEFGERKE